jgi:hypothetical protein
MFVKKAKDLGALDERQMRERAAQLLKKETESNRNGLRTIAAFSTVVMGISMVAAHLVPVFFPIALPVTVTAITTLCLGELKFHAECRDEAARLYEAAKDREEQTKLALHAANCAPAPAPVEEPVILQASTRVMAPLQFKKKPTRGAPEYVH